MQPACPTAPTPGDRFAVGAAIVLPTAITWIYFIALDGASPILQQSAYGIGKCLQFALPVVWVLLVRREPPRLSRPTGWSLLIGSLFGVAVGGLMAALYFGVLSPLGVFAEPAKAVRGKVEGFGAASPGAFLLLILFYSAIHSLLEEYYWRWFVFRELARMLPLSAAMGASSIAFAAHHVLVLQHYFTWGSPLTWLFTAGVIVGGGVWAWLYHAGRTLAGPWLSHAIVDASIFAIGYSMITT